MFDVLVQDGRGGRVRHDLHSLPLPKDGVLAHTLSQDALWRRLKPLKIEDATPNTGKQDLLISYSNYLRATQPEHILNGVWTIPAPKAPLQSRADFLEAQKGRLPAK